MQINHVRDMFTEGVPTVTMTQYVQWQYASSDDWYWKDMPKWCTDLHEAHYLTTAAGFEYNVQYCKGRKPYVRFVVDSAGVNWKSWFPDSAASFVFQGLRYHS